MTEPQAAHLEHLRRALGAVARVMNGQAGAGGAIPQESDAVAVCTGGVNIPCEKNVNINTGRGLSTVQGARIIYANRVPPWSSAMRDGARRAAGGAIDGQWLLARDTYGSTYPKPPAPSDVFFSDSLFMG